jgi:hypothetical protein
LWITRLGAGVIHRADQAAGVAEAELLGLLVLDPVDLPAVLSVPPPLVDEESDVPESLADDPSVALVLAPLAVLRLSVR